MRIKPELKGALLTVIVLVLALVGLWVWIGVRIGIWTYAQYDRHLWLLETDPIARQLWAGKIRAGDDVNALIRDWPPDQTTKFDGWAELRWIPGGNIPGTISFIGVCVIAKDGTLVDATAYSDDGQNDRVFFCTWTTNDEADFAAASRTYREAGIARFDAEGALLATNFPIYAELVSDRIQAGTNAQDVIKRWPPDLVTQFQPWTVLTWFPKNSTATFLHVAAVRIVAKNGVIVHATAICDEGDYGPDFIYFDDPQDKRDFESAYDAWEDNLVATTNAGGQNLSGASDTNMLRRRQ